ncbi:hypothetical protein C7B80_30015 [Cyanosarcina cf. burmensis CCALA 770]|nr:hypothetical protein C7B80_30015 [Cyanosarcina cf. burmensis CCALA 770]
MHKNNGYNQDCDKNLLKELKALPDDWRFTPVNGEKKSYLKDWQTKHLTKKELEKHINFDSWCRAIGLLCGTPSGGLLLLDFDGESCNEYFPKLFDVPVGDLPDTVTVTSGRPGRCQRIYKVPQQYWNSIKTTRYGTGVKGDDGKHEQIELRWTGCQSVIAGEHPLTDGYKWLAGKSPSEIEVAEAPTYLIEKMLIPTPAKSAARSTYHYRGDTTSEADKARSYLAALNPRRADAYGGNGNGEWLDVGMALHSVGDDSLLDDWDRWSQQSDNYEVGECEKKWHSFSSSGLNIGSLVYWAKQDGWKSSKEFGKQVNKGAGKNMSETEAFKRDLTAIENETDPEEQTRLKAKFMSEFRVSRQDVEKHLSERKNKQDAAKNASAFISLEQILQHKTAGIDWIFPGLLPRGETALLVGAPKVGKTIFAYGAAFAVATGDEFLGEKTPQGRVLVVQTDESINSLSWKFQRMGFTNDLNDSVKVVTNFTVTNLDLMERWITDFKPDLVIIDSLARINLGRDVNENDPKFAESIYEIRELLQKHNAACLLLHHDNKSNDNLGVHKVRGSSAIAGAVWGCIFLEHDKKPNPHRKGSFTIDPSSLHRTLALHGVRDCEGMSLHLELDPENLHWINHGEIGISKEEMEAMLSAKDRIKQALFINYPNSLSGVELKEVLKIANDTEWESVRKTLQRMVARKEVSAKPNPRQLTSRVYTLPPTLYSQMSRNLTQTYTQQPLQKGDSTMDDCPVINDTQKKWDILSRTGNADQVGVSLELRDTSTDNGGESVPLVSPRGTKPIKGDLVKYVGEGDLDGSGEDLIVVGFSDNPGTMLSTKLPLTYIKCSKPDGSEARFVSGNVYIPIEDTIIVKQQTGT